MNWFWHAIWISLIVIPATILWIVAIVDVIFRRHDLSTGKRIGFLALILFIPIIGALIYAVTIFGRDKVGDDRDYTGQPGQMTVDSVRDSVYKNY